MIEILKFQDLSQIFNITSCFEFAPSCHKYINNCFISFFCKKHDLGYLCLEPEDFKKEMMPTEPVKVPKNVVYEEYINFCRNLKRFLHNDIPFEDSDSYVSTINYLFINGFNKTSILFYLQKLESTVKYYQENENIYIS